MHLPHLLEQFPRALRPNRGLKIYEDSLRTTVSAISLTLGGAIFLEMLLFRIFSRTGIYLFHDDTPHWVYEAYKGLLWIGNSAYNFSMALAIVLLLVIGAYFWRRDNAAVSLLAPLVLVFAAWNLLLFVTAPVPQVSLAYLCISVIVIGAANWFSWHSCTQIERAFLLSAAAAFWPVYYFKAVPVLRQLGWSFNDHGLDVFQIGEAMTGVAIFAAFLAWGRTREPFLIILSAFVTALLVAGFISGPERYSLVSTWALGVTMGFPFPLYVLGLSLLGITILNLIRTRRKIIALVLVLLFFGHRMLPLTYFNLLILNGFLLFAIECLSRRMRSQRPRIQL